MARLHVSLINVTLFYFPGNVHVYRNGRMHFGHQQRGERREQPREVSEI